PGMAPVAVLRRLRAVLREVPPGLPEPGGTDRLRERAERADLLPGVPVDELERLRARLLHGALALPRAAGRQPQDQGAGTGLELERLERLRCGPGGGYGAAQRSELRRHRLARLRR